MGAIPCPDCGHTSSTWYEEDQVEVCNNCTFVLWEEL